MSCRCGAPLPNNHTALCASCMPTKPKQQPLGIVRASEDDGLVYRKMRRSPTATLETLTAAEAAAMFFHQKVFNAARWDAERGEVRVLVTPLSVVIIALAGTPDKEMRRAGDGAIASARQGKG